MFVIYTECCTTHLFNVFFSIQSMFVNFTVCTTMYLINNIKKKLMFVNCNVCRALDVIHKYFVGIYFV